MQIRKEKPIRRHGRGLKPAECWRWIRHVVLAGRHYLLTTTDCAQPICTAQLSPPAFLIFKSQHFPVFSTVFLHFCLQTTVVNAISIILAVYFLLSVTETAVHPIHTARSLRCFVPHLHSFGCLIRRDTIR